MQQAIDLTGIYSHPSALVSPMGRVRTTWLAGITQRSSVLSYRNPRDIRVGSTRWHSLETAYGSLPPRTMRRSGYGIGRLVKKSKDWKICRLLEPPVLHTTNITWFTDQGILNIDEGSVSLITKSLARYRQT